jgi:hypothetical protein
MCYTVEILTSRGWEPLCESTLRTSFRRRAVRHPTAEDAAASCAGWTPGRMRVVEGAFAPDYHPLSAEEEERRRAARRVRVYDSLYRLG